jgi:hypothetical protein
MIAANRGIADNRRDASGCFNRPAANSHRSGQNGPTVLPRWPSGGSSQRRGHQQPARPLCLVVTTYGDNGGDDPGDGGCLILALPANSRPTLRRVVMRIDF